MSLWSFFPVGIMFFLYLLVLISDALGFLLIYVKGNWDLLAFWFLLFHWVVHLYSFPYFKSHFLMIVDIVLGRCRREGC